MKRLYAILAVPGFLFPLAQLLRGIDVPTLFTSPVASMFAADLTISCIVFWIFVYSERARVRRPWLYVAFTLLVGLSFALPMFLFARERALAAS
ncbi:MAG TPA: DUF2834 domain-containing protein [Thermoanaerobaculia bacterium]|nr:DUF2834 domain-containing protein [Thermoanaerobaculia bacterium]